MNKHQTKLLIAIVIILVGMILFPPFHFICSEGLGKMEFNLGYHFILNPPRYQGIKGSGSVNVTLLLVQYVFVCTVGTIIFFLLKNKKGAEAEKQIEKETVSKEKIEKDEKGKKGNGFVMYLSWHLITIHLSIIVLGAYLHRFDSFSSQKETCSQYYGDFTDFGRSSKTKV